MCRILIVCLALMLLGGGSVTSGTIYTWTDAKGVRHFSNTPPPEDVEQVRRIEALPPGPADDDQSRRDFERMAQEAAREAERYHQEQAQQRAQAAEARRQQQEQQEAERIANERARLEQEIEALEQRAISPTFTPGMRDNLIGQIQEQIKRLYNHP